MGDERKRAGHVRVVAACLALESQVHESSIFWHSWRTPQHPINKLGNSKRDQKALPPQTFFVRCFKGAPGHRNKSPDYRVVQEAVDVGKRRH